MKVSECDFCNCESDFLIPINDGLWAICKVCMQIHYEFIPKAMNLIEEKKKEDPSLPVLSLAESYEFWLKSLVGEEE